MFLLALRAFETLRQTFTLRFRRSSSLFERSKTRFVCLLPVFEHSQPVVNARKRFSSVRNPFLNVRHRFSSVHNGFSDVRNGFSSVRRHRERIPFLRFQYFNPDGRDPAESDKVELRDFKANFEYSLLTGRTVRSAVSVRVEAAGSAVVGALQEGEQSA
jgi:hypothetical protein